MENVSIRNPKAWMVKALHDIKVIEKCIGDKELVDMVVYHAQQAAEKALKAVLIHQGARLYKTHDLLFLVNACLAYDFNFMKLHYMAAFLTGYDTYSRYPDDRFHVDLLEARQAAAYAKAIFAFVQQWLSNNGC